MVNDTPGPGNYEIQSFTDNKNGAKMGKAQRRPMTAKDKYPGISYIFNDRSG